MHSVGLHCALFDVFMLCFIFRMATFCVGDSELSEEAINDIIVVDITRFIREDEHGLISSLKEELISVMDERLRVLWNDMEAGHLKVWEVSFKEFHACGAPYFFRSRESNTSMHWIADVESAFHASFCPVEAKVRFATCILCDRARDWWCNVVWGLELVPVVEVYQFT